MLANIISHVEDYNVEFSEEASQSRNRIQTPILQGSCGHYQKIPTSVI